MATLICVAIIIGVLLTLAKVNGRRIDRAGYAKLDRRYVRRNNHRL